MNLRHGLLMVIAGAFLTFAWTSSTAVFDPRAFGVALLVAASFAIAPDVAGIVPRRHGPAFDRPETVLPTRRHQGQRADG